MRAQYPYYWLLFPPCEGCSGLHRRVRPVMRRPILQKFRQWLQRRPKNK